MRSLVLYIYILCSSVSYSQTFIVGTSKFNPPFQTWVKKDNQFYAFGYDIDIMREICNRMNIVCEFKPIRFDELFGALKDHQVDLVIASMIITRERNEQYIFSLPYLDSNAQYIANATSSINNLLDIHEKKIGARNGTPYGQLAQYTNKNNTIISYNSINDMFLGLKNNEIDVCLMDFESAKYWIATNPDTYKLIGGKIPVGEGYAIMINPEQTQVKTTIDRIILEMEEDGTFLRLYKQYF